MLKIIILHPLDHHKGGVYGIERISDFSNVETLGEGGDGTSGHGLGILFLQGKKLKWNCFDSFGGLGGMFESLEYDSPSPGPFGRVKAAPSKMSRSLGGIAS